MTDGASAPALHDDAAARTLLSWQRTAIAGAAVAGLVTRAGITGGLLAIAIPAAALILLGTAGVWLCSLCAYRGSAPSRLRRVALLRRAGISAEVVTLISACISLALAFAQ